MTLGVHPDDIVASSSSGLLAAHCSWKRVRLQDIAHVLNGFAFASTSFAKAGQMPIVRIRDVERGTTDTFFSGKYDDRYLVSHGDLLVGMDGDFRAAPWRGPRALLNQRVCKVAVRDQELYSQDFLRYLLPGYLDAIHQRTSSVTVKHLSSVTLEQLPLPLPPRAQQDRIVAAIEEQFSRLDAGVAALERVRQNLKRMRASVLQAAFVLHLTGEPMVALQTAATAQLGRMLSAKRETGHHAKPYLRNRDVQWGHISIKQLPTMDFGDKDSARFRLYPGDVLICEGGEIGRAAIWKGELLECYYQKALHRVRCSSVLDAHYLRYLLEHYALTHAFERYQSGSTIAHLPQEDLRQLPIPLPPIDEQRATVAKIEELLSIGDQASVDIERLGAKSQTLRSSILAAAFSGTLVPQDPSDEPASVLLERIAAEQESTKRRKA